MSDPKTPPTTTAAVALDDSSLQKGIGRRRRSLKDLLMSNAMLGVLIVVVIVSQVVYPRFLTFDNLMIVISQNATLGIMAAGMTVVIISGAFDLSVVAVYVFSAGLFVLTAPTISWPIATLLAIGCGLIAGVVNGLVVSRLHVNSFIATLGTGAVFSGIVAVFLGSNGASISDPDVQVLGTGSIANVPYSIIVLLIVMVVIQIVLSFTTYGRSLFSVGGNKEAARLVGMPITWLQISAFLFSGAGAALAGVIFASQVGFVQTGQLQSESGLMLDAIAVVVIGGTSLLGGEGAVWRTAIGVAIYACLGNVFAALAIQQTQTSIVRGLVLIAAVAFDSYLRRSRSA
jgi:ribose/xylose/arabinose/galactoside ABC-type transport system permease subunit